jgi:hypothetical protein
MMKVRIKTDGQGLLMNNIYEVSEIGDMNYRIGRFIIHKDHAEVVEDEKSCDNCKFWKTLVCANAKVCLKFENWQPIEPKEKLTCDDCKVPYNGESVTCFECKYNGGKFDNMITTIRRENGTTTIDNTDALKSIKQATGTTEDAVHYQIADIQPIEIMQKYLTPDEFIGAMKMQVIKYILRIGHKGSDREDAGKCMQYAKWLVDAMDGKKIIPGGKK